MLGNKLNRSTLRVAEILGAIQRIIFILVVLSETEIVVHIFTMCDRIQKLLSHYFSGGIGWKVNREEAGVADRQIQIGVIFGVRRGALEFEITSLCVPRNRKLRSCPRKLQELGFLLCTELFHNLPEILDVERVRRYIFVNCMFLGTD